MGGSVVRKGAARGKQAWRAVLDGEGQFCALRTLSHPCCPLTQPLFRPCFRVVWSLRYKPSLFPFPPTIPVWRERVGYEEKRPQCRTPVARVGFPLPIVSIPHVMGRCVERHQET